MGDAKRDSNYVPTLLAVSNADGVTPVTLYADPTTHRLLTSASGGSLAGLSDVTLTGTAQGDVLYYDGSKWVNLAAGTSGKFLQTQGAGANPQWATATAGAAGSDTQVQFNDGGTALGGDSGFVFNKTTNVATLLGAVQALTANISDSDASHYLVITASSNLSANRVLSLVTGDAARTITLSGNPTLADWFDQGVKTTSNPQFATIELGAASDTTLARVSAGVVSIEGVNIVTVSAAQTLTNKTLTSPIINTGTIGTSLVPTSDDGAALGDVTHNFSDLFLASGGVINYANGNVVLTHSSGILTMGTGELRVTTPGTNSASVPTLGSTSTLTNKTLTAPAIGGAASLADAATISIIVPTVDGTATGIVTSAFNSGYSSTAIGDLMYLDSSATWQKTDANTAALYNGLLGIALTVAASGAAVKVALPGSIVYATAFPTFTIGAPVYMSETAGAVTDTQPTTTDAAIRVIGWGVHADKLYFYPSPDYITHT